MDDERRETYKTLDLALRVGEMLLSNGAGAADVTATMLAVTKAAGLRRVTSDVTFTQLTLTHQPSVDEPATIQIRRVTHREIDYEDLTLVDHLVRDLLESRIDRDQARDRLNRLVSSGHRRPRWAVTLGWGVLGTGTAMLLGADVLVSVLAFLAAAGIDRTHRALSVRRLPTFYQQVAGGLLATSIAVAASALGLGVEPSQVVTAGIIMLLAGIGFMGATQDALAGFPITAGARILEAMLATAGVIAGVSGGLTLGRALGVHLGTRGAGSNGAFRGVGDDLGGSDRSSRVRVRLLRTSSGAAARGARGWLRHDGLPGRGEPRSRRGLGRQPGRRSRSAWSPTPSPTGCECLRWWSWCRPSYPCCPGSRSTAGSRCWPRGRAACCTSPVPARRRSPWPPGSSSASTSPSP